MMEAACFIAFMALISAALVGMMLRFPRAFTWLVVLASVVFVLLLEYGFLNHQFYPGGYTPPGESQASSLAGILHLLCLPIVLLLLAQPLIRPLRRRYSRPVALWLFASGFSLFTLQVALWSDSFNPWLFYGLIGMPASCAVALSLLVLLLWQLGVYALGRYLTRPLKRREKKAAALAAPWKRLSPRLRCALLILLPLGLLSPLLLLDLREPQPLSCPEAQRELEEISARLDTYQYVISPHAYADVKELLHEFACSHDMEYHSDELSWNILHIATIYRKPALVKHLLEHGADPNQPSVEDLSRGIMPQAPLNLVTMLDYYGENRDEKAALDLSVLRLLLEHGAKPDANNCGSNIPLVNLLQGSSGLDGVSHPHAEEMFIMLLNHGARLDTAQAYPYTWSVAEKGWPRALKRLLELGAPRERMGWHALSGAAIGASRPGAQECARLLLEAGEDVNLRSRAGDEPANALMELIDPQYTVRAPGDKGVERCGQMLLLFLEAGARLHEPWGKEKPGRSIADVLREERPELATWLEAHGVSLTQKP